MNAMDQIDNPLATAWDRLSATPQSEFMVTPDLTLKRGDLLGLMPRIAAAFDAHGVQEGDHIFICTRDEGCAVACLLTCLMDGLVPVTVSPETPDEKAAHVIDIAEARLAILDAESTPPEGIATVFVSNNTPARRKLRLRKPSAQDIIADRLGLDDMTRMPRLPDDPRGLAYILFTSGTTSDPAGVMVSRRALAANVATIAGVLEIDDTARVFNDMILSHADGLVQGPAMALLTGATLIRSGGFAVDRIEEWLNRVRTLRATHFITVPTVWSLMDRYCRHDDYFDAPEFRYLGSVAAGMPQDLWEKIERRFGQTLVSQYGLTETATSALYAGRAPGAGTPFTGGTPIDCEARIDAIDGAYEGELMLRGPNIFDGYWKNPERTQSTLTPDGWLRTGDLALRRDDGSYEIKGRLKTVVMSAGFLIRPEEIDDVLRQHQDVQEAVTVGLPHPDFGEIAASAVVCGADGMDEEALRAFAQTKLEPLKVPKHIIRVDTIPRGDAGKPRLDAVRTLMTKRLEGTAPATDTATGDVQARLMALAADVFYVSADDLSLASDPDTVEGWDSFTHIALILAIEEGFGIRIPPHRAAALRSLRDAATAVHEATK